MKKFFHKQRAEQAAEARKKARTWLNEHQMTVDLNPSGSEPDESDEDDEVVPETEMGEDEDGDPEPQHDGDPVCPRTVPEKPWRLILN